MKNFKELDKRLASEVEKSILDSWNGTQGIYEKTVEKNQKYPSYVFYDGPAFANGLPVIRYTKSIFSNFLLNQGITG